MRDRSLPFVLICAWLSLTLGATCELTRDSTVECGQVCRQGLHHESRDHPPNEVPTCHPYAVSWKSRKMARSRTRTKTVRNRTPKTGSRGRHPYKNRTKPYPLHIAYSCNIFQCSGAPAWVKMGSESQVPIPQQRKLVRLLTLFCLLIARSNDTLFRGMSHLDKEFDNQAS